MIDRMYSEYLPICDDCGAELEGYFSFQDALDGMEENGWKTIWRKDAYRHFCAVCAAKIQTPSATEFEGIT